MGLARRFEIQGTPKVSDRDRSVIAKAIMNLFDKWDIPNKAQLSLLGLSLDNRSALKGYREGKPIAADRDKLERASVLLGIHKSLHLLYPHNPELVYSFMSTPNKSFNNLTPIEVIDQNGLIGLLNVRHYLDVARGR